MDFHDLRERRGSEDRLLLMRHDGSWCIMTNLVVVSCLCAYVSAVLDNEHDPK